MFVFQAVGCFLSGLFVPGSSVDPGDPLMPKLGLDDAGSARDPRDPAQPACCLFGSVLASEPLFLPSCCILQHLSQVLSATSNSR